MMRVPGVTWSLSARQERFKQLEMFMAEFVSAHRLSSHERSFMRWLYQVVYHHLPIVRQSLAVIISIVADDTVDYTAEKTTRIV